MPIRNAPYRNPAKRRRSVSSVSKSGDLQAEIARQRRQGEREHEAVVESIRERAEHERRDQQVRVPAVKDGESRLDERQRRRQARGTRNTGRSRSAKDGDSTSSFEYDGPAREAVAERHGHQQAEDRQDRGVTEVGDVVAERPPESGDDRDDADVEERVELDEEREAIAANDLDQRAVLRLGDDAVRSPVSSRSTVVMPGRSG